MNILIFVLVFFLLLLLLLIIIFLFSVSNKTKLNFRSLHIWHVFTKAISCYSCACFRSVIFSAFKHFIMPFLGWVCGFVSFIWYSGENQTFFFFFASFSKGLSLTFIISYQFALKICFGLDFIQSFFKCFIMIDVRCSSSWPKPFKWWSSWMRCHYDHVYTVQATVAMPLTLSPIKPLYSCWRESCILCVFRFKI